MGRLVRVSCGGIVFGSLEYSILRFVMMTEGWLLRGLVGAMIHHDLAVLVYTKALVTNARS